MERRLFSELLSFYESTREKPKDMDDIQAGRVVSADEVEAEMRRM